MPGPVRPGIDASGVEVFVAGSTATADYSFDDAGGSYLASCVGSVADGAAIDTATLGRFDFAVTATDNAGNATIVVHACRVVGLPADNGRIAFTSTRDGDDEIT